MWLAKAHTQWSVVTLLAMTIIGCAPLSGSKPDSVMQPVGFAIDASTIATVKQTSQMNAIVQIKGRVSNRAPLLGKTAYELQDPTGSIWVLTTDPIPTIGDEIVLKGKLLYRSIQLNGKEQGSLYIEQQQQLQRKPALKSDHAGMKDEG
ncbi:hypothetical protein [Stenomitos frigidus]|uniref:Uncharacterized protein n=1 Tax=Stenomitos frigidus ULC18 TaxID=2107698 RepID=A0A2T1E6U3_9CYAN|nr:hypothetical protein [Stenomitos frigidus]PSB28457.1 hypothetical protein C7B82_13355 [Stenomitos frigidus ULC18]